nr:MAG TPA: hypothetical protein [Caudoviricetes sp.]
MKLHEFQKESNRLCKAYRVIGCEKCPLHKCHCATYKGLTDFAYVYDAVSAWSDSHPIKTSQSEFLKLFPNAVIDEDDGILGIKPCYIDESIGCTDEKGCDDCRREYWLAEVTDSD